MAIPAYESALELGLASPKEAKAWAWLCSSYSKTGRRGAALDAIARAEAVGSYGPSDKFERVVRAVRRSAARAR